MNRNNVIYNGWKVTHRGTDSETDTSSRYTYQCCRCHRKLKPDSDGKFGSYCGPDCQSEAMLRAVYGPDCEDASDDLLAGVLGEFFHEEFVQRKIQHCEICKREFFSRRKDKKRCTPECERKSHNHRRRQGRKLQRGNVTLWDQWEHECDGDENAWCERVDKFAKEAGIKNPIEAGFVLTQVSVKTKCQHCSELFNPKRKDAKFCCAKCRV